MSKYKKAIKILVNYISLSKKVTMFCIPSYKCPEGKILKDASGNELTNIMHTCTCNGNWDSDHNINDYSCAIQHYRI